MVYSELNITQKTSVSFIDIHVCVCVCLCVRARAHNLIITVGHGPSVEHIHSDHVVLLPSPPTPTFHWSSASTLFNQAL